MKSTFNMEKEKKRKGRSAETSINNSCYTQYIQYTIYSCWRLIDSTFLCLARRGRAMRVYILDKHETSKGGIQVVSNVSKKIVCGKSRTEIPRWKKKGGEEGECELWPITRGVCTTSPPHTQLEEEETCGAYNRTWEVRSLTALSSVGARPNPSDWAIGLMYWHLENFFF